MSTQTVKRTVNRTVNRRNFLTLAATLPVTAVPSSEKLARQADMCWLLDMANDAGIKPTKSNRVFVWDVKDAHFSLEWNEGFKYYSARFPVRVVRERDVETVVALFNTRFA